MTTELPVTKRFKPYQLSIAFGVGIGTFTMISGIVPQLTGWKSTSLIHREVFGGIPTAFQVAFYTVIPMMLIWGSLKFADRIRNWERGAPDRPKQLQKMSNEGWLITARAFTCALCCAIVLPARCTQ